MRVSLQSVVLDANVLFPFVLRDTLLRLGEEGLVELYWSDEILEELRRNLVASLRVDELRAQRLIDIMKAAFPESIVQGYQQLVSDVANDPKDRHVAAAALSVNASAIVTFNR